MDIHEQMLVSEFAAQLKVEMDRQNVTVAELAHRLGRSVRTVEQMLIDGDGVGLTREAMAAAATALGCTIRIRLKHAPSVMRRRKLMGVGITYTRRCS